MKRIPLLILTLIVAFLANTMIYFSCAKKSNTDLKIGAILPLTGSASTIGDWHKKGMSLATNDLKKSKSVDFDLILEDSQNDGKKGINAFRNLSTRYCDVFISVMSGVSTPIIPLIDQSNKPLFVTSVSFPGFTKLGRNIYRYNMTSDKEAQLMGQYLLNEHYKEINLIYINDEYGIGAIQSLKKVLANSNLKIVFESSFERSQLDFKNIIDMSSKQTPYYIIGYGNSYINLIKALIERVNHPKILTVYSMDFPEFRKPLYGKDINVVYTGVKIIKEESLLPEFSNKFKKQYNYEPNFVNILSYDLVNLIYEFWKLSPTFNLNDVKGKILGKSIYGYNLVIDNDREIQVPLEIKTINMKDEK